MDPKKLFIDDRMKGVCAHCGGLPNSRDHIPSKIFLDEPYPENLSAADSCTRCNQSFSADEEYMACLIECVVNGTTVPDGGFRPKIAATLTARPAIASKIEQGKQVDGAGNLSWQPEEERVRQVILKLARGHIAYELGIQRVEEPVFIDFFALCSLRQDDLEVFLSLPDSRLYPEIGSRAFTNVSLGKPNAFGNWFVVQKDRYQYAIGQSEGDWVKIIINDYLGCHVVWD